MSGVRVLPSMVVGWAQHLLIYKTSLVVPLSMCFALPTWAFLLTKKKRIIRATTTAIEVLLTLIRFTMTYPCTSHTIVSFFSWLLVFPLLYPFICKPTSFFFIRYFYIITADLWCVGRGWYSICWRQHVLWIKVSMETLRFCHHSETNK